MLSQILSKKSEMVMLIAGVSILASVFTVMFAGDFVFWKIAKVFYAAGVVLIIFDK